MEDPAEAASLQQRADTGSLSFSQNKIATVVANFKEERLKQSAELAQANATIEKLRASIAEQELRHEAIHKQERDTRAALERKHSELLGDLLKSRITTAELSAKVTTLVAEVESERERATTYLEKFQALGELSKQIRTQRDTEAELRARVAELEERRAKGGCDCGTRLDLADKVCDDLRDQLAAAQQELERSQERARQFEAESASARRTAHEARASEAEAMAEIEKLRHRVEELEGDCGLKEKQANPRIKFAKALAEPVQEQGWRMARVHPMVLSESSGGEGTPKLMEGAPVLGESRKGKGSATPPSPTRKHRHRSSKGDRREKEAKRRSTVVTHRDSVDSLLAKIESL
eukprot:m51a1_g12377 hypothetical protein (349) ;mRNA; r:612853-614592